MRSQQFQSLHFQNARIGSAVKLRMLEQAVIQYWPDGQAVDAKKVILEAIRDLMYTLKEERELLEEVVCNMSGEEDKDVFSYIFQIIEQPSEVEYGGCDIYANDLLLKMY